MVADSFSAISGIILNFKILRNPFEIYNFFSKCSNIIKNQKSIEFLLKPLKLKIKMAAYSKHFQLLNGSKLLLKNIDWKFKKTVDHS
jgi:hypothetical protein